LGLCKLQRDARGYTEHSKDILGPGSHIETSAAITGATRNHLHGRPYRRDLSSSTVLATTRHECVTTPSTTVPPSSSLPDWRDVIQVFDR